MCNRMRLKHADRLDLWSREWMEWEFLEFIARYNISPTERIIIGRLDAALLSSPACRGHTIVRQKTADHRTRR